MAKSTATTKKATKRATRPMSNRHKAALAAGREEGRAVRRYLDALEAHKPKRGRKRTVESVKRDLDNTLERLAGASPLDRVMLLQRRMDLESALYQLESEEGTDLTELEEGFIEVAASYSERKGVSYNAWREAGIAPRVLKAAGISRSA